MTYKKVNVSMCVCALCIPEPPRVPDLTFIISSDRYRSPQQDSNLGSSRIAVMKIAKLLL